MAAIGVVSVNFMAHDMLNRCLTSLKQHCKNDLHFIVVDNSPIPETDLITKDHPEITAIVPRANTGFAGGCNLGISQAMEQELDYILLLNPDTWTEHDFIDILLKELENDPLLGMVGPKILRDNGQGDAVWYGGARMNWWKGGPSQVMDSRHDGDGPALAVPCLSGCAMLIKAQAIREVGMMDERYFLYYEDTDYCQRFIEKGFTLAYVPAARLIHEVSSTVGFQSRNYVYYFSRNRVWFMRRWATWYQYLVFMA
ncbi:MAG: glycosyltransferase family 2 protein, partial [Desulfobulbaceae bacterium]|nr:glycosyltransferase family 2 protein [Desulfobulbaceae bacterium]